MIERKDEESEKESFNTVNIRMSKPRVNVQIKVSTHFEKEKLSELILFLKKNFAPRKGFVGLVVFLKSPEELKTNLISKKGLVVGKISPGRATDMWITIKEFVHTKFLEIEIIA